jgi:pimeloyl-ACP methyl ester carboxylesterase
MLSLILLPGLACDAELWRDQLPALADPALGYRVAISDVHQRCTTLPEMARTLLGEHPGRHVLVGASMGGMLALEVQRQAPQQVQALALLGSSPRPDTPEQRRLRSDAIGYFEAGRLEEVLQANMLFAFHPRSQGMHGRAQMVHRYTHMVLGAGAPQLIAQNRAVMARGDSRPGLPAVACPTLVLCGEADKLTPPEHSQDFVAPGTGIPGARLHTVPGAGHMLTMEQPAAVNRLLLDWLATL